MGRWMINCKEHSRLASEGMDRPLSFWDHLGVRIHRLICPACKRLKAQLDAIRLACRLIPSESDESQARDPNHVVLPKEACRRIKAALREHLE